MTTDFSSIRQFDLFSLNFQHTNSQNIFAQTTASAAPTRWSLSDLFDPSITLFDIPDGEGRITGSATATIDGGLQFTYPSAANTGTLTYDLGAKFLGPVAREDGQPVTYGFAPGRTVGKIQGTAFDAPLKAEVFVNAAVDYQNLHVTIPPVFGSPETELDLGSGRVAIAETGEEPMLTLFDSSAASEIGGLVGSRQIVVFPDLIDLILNPIAPQAFELRTTNDTQLRSRAWATGVEYLEDALAPDINGTLESNVFIDGQLDLDAITQTAVAMIGAGLATGGAASAAMLAYVAKNGGPIDFLELGLLDKLLGTVAPNEDIEDAAKYFLESMPVYADAELVLLDITANLGLRLNQDISFDPEISYTIDIGDVSRTAGLHEALQFTDAEIDAMSEGVSPSISFTLGGTLSTDLRIAPVTSLSATALQAKFQLKTGGALLSTLGYVPKIFNYSGDALWSQNFPENGISLGAGLSLQSLSAAIDPIVIDPVPLRLSTYQPTTVQQITTVGMPFVLSDSNTTATGTANNDELKADPFATFFNKTLVMNGAGGDDVIRAVNLGAESELTQIGGAGNDLIEASGRVEAGTGNDTVEVFEGSSSRTIDILLGEGDDYVYTVEAEGAWVRSIQGGVGNDTLDRVGARGWDSGGDIFSSGTAGVIDLGEGDDQFIGTFADVVLLGAGNDTVRDGSFSHFVAAVGYQLDAGDGDDDISVKLEKQITDPEDPEQETYVQGGAGQDYLQIRGEIRSLMSEDVANATIDGGAGEDVIYLRYMAGTVQGGDDADDIYGQTFSNLYGDDGDDTLTLGEEDRASFYLPDYDDNAFAQGRTSFVSGGEGDDLIQIILEDQDIDRRAGVRAEGGAGNDVIRDHFGLAVDDASSTYYIATSDDVFDGGDDADSIHASAGDDTITGGGGNDLLSKLNGAVELDAGTGDDTIVVSSADGLRAQDYDSSFIFDFMDNRLQGGVVTGSVAGGAGHDLLALDLARLFDERPDFTTRDAVTLAWTGFAHSTELAGAWSVASVEIIYDTLTSGRISYIGTQAGTTGETQLGVLEFSGIETLLLQGMTEQGHLRGFAHSPVSFDFSALGATHTEIEGTSTDTVSSFFDPNFGVSGAQGNRFDVTHSGEINVWKDGVLLPVDAQFQDFVFEELSETLSPLHPVSVNRVEYDLLSSLAPGPQVDPVDIVATGSSPNAPTLGATGAQVSVRPNTAHQLSLSDLPATDGDTDPDAVFYRIVDTPDLGFMALGEDMIDTGAVFSQQDLADGLVFYVHMAGIPVLTDTVVVEVYDDMGNLAGGGDGAGRQSLSFQIDTSVRIGGALSAEQAGFAADGTEITEIIFQTDAPVVGTQYVTLSATGPAASGFAGLPTTVVIEHGQSSGVLQLAPLAPVAMGSDALTLTAVDSSLGLDISGLAPLVLDSVAASQVRPAGRGTSADDFLYEDGLPTAFVQDEAAQIFRLYQSALGREADAAGHQDWVTRLYEGTRTIEQIAAGFVGSVEFSQVYGQLGDTAYVELLYGNVLGRASDPTGLQGWLDALADGNSRAQVLLGFSDSAEFRASTVAEANSFAMTTTVQTWSDDVFRLYSATLDRDPDLVGFTFWSGKLAEGQEYRSVVSGFTNSTEFTNTYGTLSDDGFIELLYHNVLDRASDGPGKQHWLDTISNGATRDQVVEGFAQSAEFQNTTAPDLAAWMRTHGTDDTLEARDGANVLAGGYLSDVFVLNPQDGGSHLILDAEPWDSLDLTAFGFVTEERARQSLSQEGADVVFDAYGVTARLLDMSLGDITDDMLLV